MYRPETRPWGIMDEPITIYFSLSTFGERCCGGSWRGYWPNGSNGSFSFKLRGHSLRADQSEVCSPDINSSNPFQSKFMILP